MLVDLKLMPADAYMVQRAPDGRTTISLPLEVLTRAFAAFQANRAHLESAAQQERVQ
jgi:hypothetical protein